MEVRWRKPALSEGANNCVELGHLGMVRDSKNPAGPALRVELNGFLAAVKAGSFDRWSF